LVWAARKWFRRHGLDAERISSTLGEIHREFGLKSRLASFFLGPLLYRKLEKEERRIADGWTYEPTTVYEENPRALQEEATGRASLKRRRAEIQWATCEPSPAAGMK
jgi:hypothetical protein